MDRRQSCRGSHSMHSRAHRPDQTAVSGLISWYVHMHKVRACTCTGDTCALRVTNATESQRSVVATPPDAGHTSLYTCLYTKLVRSKQRTPFWGMAAKPGKCLIELCTRHGGRSAPANFTGSQDGPTWANWAVQITAVTQLLEDCGEALSRHPRLLRGHSSSA